MPGRCWRWPRTANYLRQIEPRATVNQTARLPPDLGTTARVRARSPPRLQSAGDAFCMSWLYRNLLRPALFTQDPEEIHQRTLRLLGWVGRHELVKDAVGSFLGAPELPI